MKKIILSAFAATAVLMACNSSESTGNKKDSSTNTVATGDTKKDEPWVAIPDSVMMQKMMEYGTPGEMQKMLAASNGTWTGDVKMWMHDGDSAQHSTTTAVNTMIMGGRYQMSKHSGNMMGMPFEGQSIVGYDNALKKFVSTWVDNMGTGIMMMEGNWDAATKSMTLTGSMPDVCRPGKTCSLREVFTMVDDNTQHMEMYGPDSKTGKEFKTMEIVMTRKK